MTEYLKDKFTVPLGGEAYRNGWERIFGKKVNTLRRCPVCKGKGTLTVFTPEGDTDQECTVCDGWGTFYGL